MSAWYRCLPLVLWAGCATTPELPPRAAELNALGAAALAGGDLESADARLSLALEYSPDFVEALTNLGLVEVRRGNFDRAEQLLLRSRRLNPDVAQTHHGLGVLEERRHRFDLASEHYRAALEVDPGFVEARANLARLLFEARRFEYALVQYRLLYEAAPERVEGSYGMVATLLSLERVQEAGALLEAAQLRFGDVPELRLLRGRWHLLLGQPERAVSQLLPLTTTNSGLTPGALAWTAVCELAQGRLAEAVQAADAALRLEPDDPLATYALAMALDDLDDPAAAEWLERALLLNPGHPLLGARLRARSDGGLHNQHPSQ